MDCELTCYRTSLLPRMNQDIRAIVIQKIIYHFQVFQQKTFAIHGLLRFASRERTVYLWRPTIFK